MFNLEAAIQQWRATAAAEGLANDELLDELEGHLWETIEHHLQSGLDEEVAFERALAQIGDIRSLRAEFVKSWSTPKRQQKFFRWLYVSAVVYLALINTWTLLEFDLSLAQGILGFSFLFLSTLYLALLPHWLRYLSSRHYLWLVQVLKIFNGIMCLWPFVALAQALHYVNLRIGPLPELLLWWLCGTAGLSVVAFGLYRRDSSPEWGTGPSASEMPAQPIPPIRPGPAHLAIPLVQDREPGQISRELLHAASQEATRLGHDFIGTEHVLLGLLRMATGVFSETLAKLDLDRETTRLAIEKMAIPFPHSPPASALPLTPRARKAFKLAAREARKLHQTTINDELVFLGLLLEGSGVAARVLTSLGLRPAQTRQLIRTAHVVP